ncbi:MAG: ATP-binding protein [bacterium]|nr:ATP-binding protein [bacterium]
MNPYALFSLTAGVVSAVRGVIVSLQDPGKTATRVYLSAILFQSIFTFGEGMMLTSTDPDTAAFWCKIEWTGISVFSFIYLHLALVFPKKRKILDKKIVYLLIYLPGLILIYLSLATNWIVKGVEPTSWAPYYSIFGEGFKIFSVVFGLSLLLILSLYFQIWRTSSKKREKRQAGWMLVSLILPITGGSVTNIILPLMNIYVFPMATIFLMVMTLLITYAMFRYKAIFITPTIAADTIIATMPDALVLLDSEGKIQLVNNALLAMLGYSRDELKNRHLDVLLKNPDKDKKPEIMDLICQNGFRNREITLVSGADREIPVLASASQIRDEEGELVGSLIIAHDIREIKQLESRLLQTSKMTAIGQLAGGVAHELNNPIGVILGFAQSVTNRIKPEDPLYMPLKSIERESLRCKNLIGNLLTFSRVSRTSEEETDINTLLDETMSLIEAQSRVSNIRLIREYAEQLPKIKVNRNQIQQVIVNLINNAMDAISGAGNVTITTNRYPAGKQAGKGTDGKTAENGYLEIKVRDTGAGIRKENLDKIFEPFFTTKEVGKGTGLGLSLCYEIIKKHNGNIQVESEPGKGSTFIILLPIEKNPA